jgi:Holliday junction resolvase RusA-like endonuclease
VTPTFDYATATPGEILAEANRRDDLRRRGLPIAPRVEWLDMDRVQRRRLPELPDSDISQFDNRTARRLRLPWSTLVPDNQRMAPALRGKRAVLVMTKVYRNAKKRAARALCDQNAFPPLSGPVAVRALLFEPDRRTRRDVANYSKLVHDALVTGGVLVDDSQIDELHWARAGVDIDAPRLELLVEPLLRGAP